MDQELDTLKKINQLLGSLIIVFLLGTGLLTFIFMRSFDIEQYCRDRSFASNQAYELVKSTTQEVRYLEQQSIIVGDKITQGYRWYIECQREQKTFFII